MFNRGIAITALSLCALSIFAAGCGGGGGRVGDDINGPKFELNWPGDRVETEVLAPEAMYHDLRRHTQKMYPGRIMYVGASRDGSRYVISIVEGQGTPQIYLLEADGVAATRLTGNRYSNKHPRLSPDGKLVAFASNRSGNWDIFVTRVDAPTTFIQVTFDESDEEAPAWSPDGKYIVYASKGDSGIWMVKYSDWRSGIVTTLGPGMFPDWGAKNLIAFQTQKGTTLVRSGINIVRPDGKEPREVHFDRRGMYSAVLPRWSPNGNWLVFGVQDGNETELLNLGHSRDLWVVRHDGTSAVRLTGHDLVDEWWPSWGGNRIFFVSNRDSGYENVYSIEPRLMDSPEEEEGAGK